MSPKEAALTCLDGMGIPYRMANHAPVRTIDDCAEAERLLGAMMPRNIFLCTANQSCFALLLCRPHAVFKTSLVSKQAGLSRLSFAPEDKIAQYLGTYPGAVSPLGLIFDKNREVRFLMDERLLEEESLLFHPLDNSCSVRIDTQAFTGIFLKRLGYEICRVKMD
ncbi:MAG: prolyl-tRNA synthetase associated domain-containing protein [Clostridia bacterium]|nr:prolyl-tRNA synthetase associated domain-containing protein [Clostridia bacterium]